MHLTDEERDRLNRIEADAERSGDTEALALVRMMRGETTFRGYPAPVLTTPAAPAVTPQPHRRWAVSALLWLLRRLSGRPTRPAAL